MKKVIAIDMDDVLADLVSSWVEKVNTNEGCNVKTNEITTWNIHNNFKCGNKVYEYLNYDLFRNLPVIQDSQLVVSKLIEKYDVYIVTSATKYLDSLKAKIEWLNENFPYIDSSKIVLCGNKSIIKADIMIDDGVHNLKVFEGKKLLFDGYHNRECNLYQRVHSWKEIEYILL